ncbi:MAG: IreB family regulatory phosphoprotein [Ruminococcaceae bacterium]|nr:IreB family regulatory phosphoprotein [Oscillospiraceae bacterium]
MYQPDQTVTFPLASDKERQNRMILQEVYSALLEKGYNPINQIVGYLLSEDPTYITNYKNARSLIRKIDRDDLLGSMLREYLHNDHSI